MNDLLLSMLLGILEGLTEFVPVSSTAHLRLAQSVLGVDLNDGFWKMYAVVIQLGAILCLPIHFREPLSCLVRSFPKGERGDRSALTHPLTLTLVAFLVTAVPAYLLQKQIGKNLESLMVMGMSLVAGGIVMWGVDVLFTHPRLTRVTGITFPQAAWIGAAQVVSAVFPGVSRSMSTIAAGQMSGMSRTAAVEFSFYLSIPTMVAATGYDLLNTVILANGGSGDSLSPVTMTPHLWRVLGVGFAVSFLTSWCVVALFMAWVRTRGLAPFAIYRIALGTVVLTWLT